jgi:hypothetical protein
MKNPLEIGPKVNVFGQRIGLLELVVSALAIYLIVRLALKIKRKDQGQPPPPAPITQASGDKFQSAMDPSFWSRYSGNPRLISAAQAAQFADDIYDSKGIFNDDEERVRLTLFTAGSIANVSRIASEFQRKYNRSMLSYLNSFLNTEEMQEYVLAPIDSLPWV